ncbi:MAG TPA: hypothetical protein VHW46_11300 [Terracidiphilus sp.]|jgi:hypothetical protein|nr:hypothetical protein [Terracidiphilus sp.]
MLRKAGRWLLRAVLVLIALGIATYAVDWIAFRLQGSPQSSVTVNRTLVVPLKNNKQEYDYVGTFDEPCSVSLFPQVGLTPCWQLRRNPNENETI